MQCCGQIKNVLWEQGVFYCVLRRWALFEREDVFNRALEFFCDEQRKLERRDIVALFHRANRLATRVHALGELFLGEVFGLAESAEAAMDRVFHGGKDTIHAECVKRGCLMGFGMWYHVGMNVKRLYILRQSLLGISIVYFYVIAIGIQRGWDMDGWQDPIAFAAMGAVFLAAILIEATVVWWNHRQRIVWGLIAIASYAMIGFVAAPRFYGESAITIALAVPLVMVFFGGFTFVFAHLFLRAFTRRKVLSPTRITEALTQMPGWVFINPVIQKRFHFSSLEQANRFAEACLVVGATFHRQPEVQLYQSDVVVRIHTPDLGGIMERDLALAKEIDQR